MSNKDDTETLMILQFALHKEDSAATTTRACSNFNPGVCVRQSLITITSLFLKVYEIEIFQVSIDLSRCR